MGAPRVRKHGKSLRDEPADRRSADLQTALNNLQEADAFVIQRLDRLSQDMEDLRSAVLLMSGRGVALQFIRELLQLKNPDRGIKQLCKVIQTIADLQRELLDTRRQQPAEASQSARRGRKPSLSSERIAELHRRAAAGANKSGLAQEFGISRDTLYRYLASR